MWNNYHHIVRHDSQWNSSFIRCFVRNEFENIWISVMELIDFRRMGFFPSSSSNFFSMQYTLVNCKFFAIVWLQLFVEKSILNWPLQFPHSIQNHMIYEISCIREIATFWPFHQCYFSNSKSDKKPHFTFCQQWKTYGWAFDLKIISFFTSIVCCNINIRFRSMAMVNVYEYCALCTLHNGR